MTTKSVKQEIWRKTEPVWENGKVIARQTTVTYQDGTKEVIALRRL